MKFLRYISLTLALSCAWLTAAQAQTSGADGVITVEALFKYPEAPEYLDNIQNRCDYLMEHFWDSMNFKQKVVNQAALQHAFSVYAAPMQWAQKAKVINSVQALMKKMEKNPSLATQFMIAAEETFHSPRSEVYIDEIYALMIENYLKNKKVPAERKAKYASQLEALKNTEPGMAMPTATLYDQSGDEVSMLRGKKFTICIFGPVSNYELRSMLLRLNSDVAVERLCGDDRLAIDYLCTQTPDAETAGFMATLPSFVHGAYIRRASSTYDLRIVPSVYLLDADGAIMARNITLPTAFEMIGLALANENETANQE